MREMLERLFAMYPMIDPEMQAALERKCAEQEHQSKLSREAGVVLLPWPPRARDEGGSMIGGNESSWPYKTGGDK